MDGTPPAPSRRFRRPEPRDVEARFDLPELFFSTTDAKGRIRSGNDVFARVSGYTLDELTGQPHNLIRHPDVPRAVFRLLWRTIGEGRPMAAYVKNLARSGAYYWVMALVVPAPGGYLSVRLKPTTPLFDTVRQVYAELVGVERAVIAEGGPRAGDRAMDTAEGRLGELLASAGFDSYDAFMRAALPAEVQARAAALDAAQRAGASEEAERAPALAACHGVESALSRLIGRIGEYGELTSSFLDRSREMLRLAEGMRILALNAMLASERTGLDGAAVGRTAGLLRERSDAISPTVRSLGESFDTASHLLDDLRFRIAAAELQTEMATAFVRERLGEAGGPGDEADGTGEADESDGANAARDDLRVLAACLDDGVAALGASLDGVAEHMRALGAGLDALASELRTMRVLEVNGRVEASRLAGTKVGELVGLFDAVGESVRVGDAQVSSVRGSIASALSGDASAISDAARYVAELRACVEGTGVTDTRSLSAAA